MSRFTTTLAIAAAGLTFTVAADASAQKKDLKTRLIRMPASAIASPDARICMPRSTSPIVGKDKSLPQTLCQTVAQWSQYGVSIIPR